MACQYSFVTFFATIYAMICLVFMNLIEFYVIFGLSQKLTLICLFVWARAGKLWKAVFIKFHKEKLYLVIQVGKIIRFSVFSLRTASLVLI